MIAIVVFEGVDELDAVGPYRVFAGAAGPDSVSMRSIEETDSVTAGNGLSIGVDGPLDAVDPDLLVVPGGGWTGGADRGVRAAIETGCPAAVRDHHEAGATVAGVCTGAMVLARAGLLDGRPATTHAGAMADLPAEANAIEARVVDSGDVLTCGGVTAGLDLALHLVEREWGSQVARSVAITLEYDRRGRVVTS